MKPLRWIFFGALAAAVMAAPAQAATHLLHLQHPLEDKDFYLLSVLQQSPAVQRALAGDKALAAIAEERQRIAAGSIKACKGNVACMVKSQLWTEEEIHAVGLELEHLAQTNSAVHSLVETRLRPSRTYVLFEKQPAGELLASAWGICARGINDVLMVYGEGLPPRYPAIDSISMDVKSAGVQQQVAALVAANPAPQEFFSPSLNTALGLLQMNHRDEAACYEPMETGENAAALRAIETTNWQKYPYSVIVVPGEGPADYQTALNPTGLKRCELAAAAWRAGEAPFLLVSGGHVHPAQTKYSEAIEMKRALMQQLHVPESAIIVDPHARHTTTNMRNAAREMYRYGMPFTRQALVVSDPGQIGYIAGAGLAMRCLRELGYVPYKILSQPSPTELVFLPQIQSLEQDPMEPLDP